ncbi:hypothetical protein M0813_28273 [Anaeramoeba flamelloides]|uniref:B-block binding subunit of TFIIIC domain-containing protein n=1 Tax=Anaeramoeba flamelloides TaxID=1746091 RepID=A0ABQ8XW08_9EUKA|nr:hypothetical protein M0813_28273 [Anaeramoeba flamelloides]
MEYIQDKENTTERVDFIGLHFAFAIYLFDNYEDSAFIQPQKIQKEFQATLPLWITKRLKNELPDIVQIFIQTHLLSNEKSTKKRQLLILNKSWRPIIGNIKYRKKSEKLNRLSQQEQKEMEELKRNSAQRKSKTISMLSVLVLNELRNGVISRDLISKNTGFARQRICTVLSVFKALGIVKETGTRRTLRVVLNKNKLGNISSLFEQTKAIVSLREKKTQLLQKTQKLLNDLDSVHANKKTVLNREKQKSLFNQIHLQLIKKMNNKLKIKKKHKRISKIQIPNLKKRKRNQKLKLNNPNTMNKVSDNNTGNYNKNNKTHLKLDQSIIDSNMNTILFNQGDLLKNEFPKLDEKTRIRNFKRTNTADHQCNINTRNTNKTIRKVRTVKTTIRDVKNKKKKNINAMNSNNINIKGAHQSQNNCASTKKMNGDQINKPTLKISTKLIRETFNPNIIPTQISPLIRDENLNIRLSSPFFETDFINENDFSSKNFEDNFDFQSSFSSLLSSNNLFNNSKPTFLQPTQTENDFSSSITQSSISISNDPLFSFSNSPAISNSIKNTTQSPYLFLNSPPLFSNLNQKPQKNYQNQSNCFQSHNQPNKLLSPRLQKNRRPHNLKNEHSQFKTPYFMSKRLPDLSKLIGSDYK